MTTRFATSGATRSFLLIGGLTVLAFVLRLAGNGMESIWYDEAVSVILATTNEPIDSSIWRVHDAGNPPGYFLLLRCWLWLWGDARVETARTLSALAGALTVPAVWLLAARVGAPRRAAWLACILVAVSPPLVYLGQEARVFALFATLVTLLAATTAWIKQADRPAAWISFAGLGAILVHLHYYAFFVLTALGLNLLVWAWPRRWKPLFKLAGAAVFVGLAFLPWLDNFRWQMSQGATRSAESWWQQLAFTPAASVVGHTLVWKEEGSGAVAIISMVVIVFIYLPTLALLLRAHIRPGTIFSLVVGVLTILVALAVAGMPMINYRYISALFPALMLVLAWGLALGSWRSWLTLMPMMALVAVMTPALARVYLVRHKPDWRGLAAHIEKFGPDRVLSPWPILLADNAFLRRERLGLGKSRRGRPDAR
jgi:4-amino-4-deoxy-L-arabinose transferase-like glycosyltransferase